MRWVAKVFSSSPNRDIHTHTHKKDISTRQHEGNNFGVNGFPIKTKVKRV